MADQIREDVRLLAAAGGRMAGSPGHAEARAYIVRRLDSLGAQAYARGSLVLPYRHGGQDFANVVAQLPGSDRSLAPVLLGAHYDTCEALPGADDNAAAVAVLLSVGEALRRQRRHRTVLLAFFDAEEPPHFLRPAMGSIRFYEDQRIGPIHCAVILDLVGHNVPVPGLEDLLFVTGMESHPGLEGVIKKCQPASGVRTVPTLNRYLGDLSDHHVFRMNKRPYLLLTCGRWQHYHRATDTADRLNYQKIESLAAYLGLLTRAICEIGLDGQFEGYDTTATELECLNRTVRPALEKLGMRPELRSRQDIERLVMAMSEKFGL